MGGWIASRGQSVHFAQGPRRFQAFFFCRIGGVALFLGKRVMVRIGAPKIYLFGGNKVGQKLGAHLGSSFGTHFALKAESGLNLA